MEIREYATGKLLAKMGSNPWALNAWCKHNGYLPHRKIPTGWIVIKR